MDQAQTAKTDKGSSIDRDIDRLRKELVTLRGYLMSEPSPEVLVEFDAQTVDLIGEIMGSSSPMIEAYEYATVGEAAGLINAPEEGLEGTTHESQRETLRQRQRVLESCVSDLETRRAAASVEGGKKDQGVRPPRVGLHVENHSSRDDGYHFEGSGKDASGMEDWIAVGPKW